MILSGTVATPLIDAPSAVSTMSPTNELSDLSKPVNG